MKTKDKFKDIVKNSSSRFDEQNKKIINAEKNQKRVLDQINYKIEESETLI